MLNAVAARQWQHQGLPRAAGECDKLPSVLTIHENRGLNPSIEDVARRLAVANFITFAPDGLTSVGGYPGDDEKGAALFGQVDRAKMGEDFSRRANTIWLRKSRPEQHRQAWRRGLLFWRRHCQPACRCGWALTSARRCHSMELNPTLPRRLGSGRRSMRSTPNSTRVSPADGKRSMLRSRRHMCHTRVISTKPRIMASTTTPPPVTTRPQPGKPGSTRWIGSTSTSGPDRQYRTVSDRRS